jgi:hypothetical protein
MSANKMRTYGALALWIVLSTLGLSQDNWILTVFTGIASIGIGLGIALAHADQADWTLPRKKVCSLIVVFSGIGLIVYAVIDHFIIGWKPGMHM